MAQPMTSILDSLINQLIPLKPGNGNNVTNSAHQNPIEAQVIQVTKMAGSTTTSDPAFKIIVISGKQPYELSSNTAIPVGSLVKLTIAQNNVATILNISQAEMTALNGAALNSTLTKPVISSTAIAATSITAEHPYAATLTKLSANRSTIEQALRQTLPQQQAVRTLLPLLQQIAQQPPRHWPPQLTHNLQVLLQQFPSATQLQQPQGVKNAVANNGIFLEAKLAQWLNNPPLASAQNNPQNHLQGKALTLDIKALIARVIGQIDKVPTADTIKPLAAAKSLETTDLSKQLAPVYTPLPLNEAILSNSHRNGTATGSANEQGLDVLLRQLSSLLLSSLARTQLNQLETLSTRRQHTVDNQGPANSWTLEIPIMQGKHIDNLTLRIDQQPEDEQQSNKPTNRKLWTVMLSFDLHALGKMTVQLKVLDQSVSATVWSQLEHTHHQVKQQIDNLKKNLEKTGVKVKQIECQLGLPEKTPRPLYSQLVDVRT